MAKNSRVSWAAASAALAVLTMVAIVFMAGWESEVDEHYQVVEEASPVRGLQWNPRMVRARRAAARRQQLFEMLGCECNDLSDIMEPDNTWG